jgi:hypothetical protein
MLILKCLTTGGAFPLVGEEEDDGIHWRNSQCPSLGCLALGADQRRMEWNGVLVIDLGSPLPPRSDLIPCIMR